MTDAYAYWRNALAGTFGPVHDGDAQNGFYRKRAFKDGPWQAVAIFDHEGRKVALADNKSVDPAQIWNWVCQYPITEEAYHRAVGGGGWADEPPAPPSQVSGSNLPSDPFEALQIEFAAERETAEEYLRSPVETKEQADRAAVLSKRIAAISSKATNLHKVEKQPHLDAGRAVDSKWRGLKEDPDALVKRIKAHLTPYLREQDRLEKERQEAARKEAERLQREAEDARLAAERAAVSHIAGGMVDAGAIKAHNDSLDEAARLEQEAADKAKEAEARNAAAGRTGAKVALRTFVYGEITDFETLLLALKDRPEIIDLVQTLANRAAKSGVELPGMAIKSEQRAA